MPMPLRVCPKNRAHADHFLVEMPQVSPPRAWLQGCLHATEGENGQGALYGEARQTMLGYRQGRGWGLGPAPGLPVTAEGHACLCVCACVLVRLCIWLPRIPERGIVRGWSSWEGGGLLGEV